MIPDERTVALLRVLGGIAGLLSASADGIDRGKRVTAHCLRDLAQRLRDEQAQLWDRLLPEAAGREK
jgi:hypothetical protein